MRYLSKVLLLFFIFISISISAQIKLKLNLESGLYNDFSSDDPQSDLLSKVLGSIEFKEGSGNNAYKLGAKLRPQFLNTDFHSIKYRLDGAFNHKSDNLNLKANLSYTNYNYQYTASDYSYGLLQFITALDLPVHEQLPVTFLFGYSNYDVNYVNTINSDILIFSVLYNKGLTDYSFLSIGAFTQSFNIDSRLNTGDELKSKGWKYGPQLKLQYMRKFLFNAEYKFLIYNSNHTKYPSYEHNINLVAGTIINRNISIFLLSEFNFIRTKIKNSSQEDNPIFYTPTQNENEIYLKTSLKLNPDFSIYSKVGYFRENFYLEEFKLDGISFLIGIEIKR